jgi:hypothetical protein
MDMWNPGRNEFHQEWRYRMRPADVIEAITQAERATVDKWLESIGRRLPLPKHPKRAWDTADT